MSLVDIPREIQEIMKRMKEVKGVLWIKPLMNEERKLILEAEEKAEERKVLGGYKPFNASVREALSRGFTMAIAVNSTEFPYDYHPIVKLVQGSIVLGEEIENPEEAARLRAQGGNIFLWNRFVLYSSRIAAMRAKSRMEGSSERLIAQPRLLYMPKPIEGLPLPRHIKRLVIGCPSLEGHAVLLNILGIEVHGEGRANIGTFLLGFDLERDLIDQKDTEN
ncbi:hypothetical protein KEJ36_03860 [Candidatus Bathyarchaeota archaeon]|nr:hypothetical protein [Candidatus Bathyarchaeota archaeon]MBS7627934.1 hypothetical protein [Candidatus Bathyarchaeota archaeon]